MGIAASMSRDPAFNKGTRGGPATDAVHPAAPQLQRSAAAETALVDLIGAIDVCIDELHEARRRARELKDQRDGGRAWAEIVTAEEPPLVVERISTALSTLSDHGSRWRRAEALALQAEGLSINRIASLFRVTRQRVSVLVNGQAPERDVQR
jgi:hypothetical protein